MAQLLKQVFDDSSNSAHADMINTWMHNHVLQQQKTAPLSSGQETEAELNNRRL